MAHRKTKKQVRRHRRQSHRRGGAGNNNAAATAAAPSKEQQKQELNQIRSKLDGLRRELDEMEAELARRQANLGQEIKRLQAQPDSDEDWRAYPQKTKSEQDTAQLVSQLQSVHGEQVREAEKYRTSPQNLAQQAEIVNRMDKFADTL